MAQPLGAIEVAVYQSPWVTGAVEEESRGFVGASAMDRYVTIPRELVKSEEPSRNR